MLQALPLEIQTLIFTYLHGKPLLNLSHCNAWFHRHAQDAHLWTVFVEERFQSHPEDHCPIQTYFDLDRKSRVLFGSDLRIVWLDESHWRLSGKSAILQMVWWFQVEGTFCGLQKGIYAPVLHLEFKNAYGLNNLVLDVMEVQSDQEHMFYSYSFNSVDTADGFQTLTLPTVSLGQSKGVHHRLKFTLNDFDSMSMKRGLILHSIHLKQIQV